MTLQAPGGYHGYWQIDLYQIDPHFGTSDDLIALVEACHNAGVWVMLDGAYFFVSCMMPPFVDVTSTPRAHLSPFFTSFMFQWLPITLAVPSALAVLAAMATLA